MIKVAFQVSMEWVDTEKTGKGKVDICLGEKYIPALYYAHTHTHTPLNIKSQV